MLRGFPPWISIQYRVVLVAAGVKENRSDRLCEGQTVNLFPIMSNSSFPWCAADLAPDILMV